MSLIVVSEQVDDSDTDDDDDSVAIISDQFINWQSVVAMIYTVVVAVINGSQCDGNGFVYELLNNSVKNKFQMKTTIMRQRMR